MFIVRVQREQSFVVSQIISFEIFLLSTDNFRWRFIIHLERFVAIVSELIFSITWNNDYLTRSTWMLCGNQNFQILIFRPKILKNSRYRNYVWMLRIEMSLQELTDCCLAVFISDVTPGKIIVLKEYSTFAFCIVANFRKSISIGNQYRNEWTRVYCSQFWQFLKWSFGAYGFRFYTSIHRQKW